MKVKASILTYRESEMTLKCANSLLGQVDEIEIVSNSSNGSAEQGLAGFDVIKNDRNEAFSTCINGAAKRALKGGFDGLVFVTNDVTFSPGVVDRLSVVLSRDIQVAGVMPMQLREDDRGIVHHGGGELFVKKWKAILKGGSERLSDGWDRDSVEDRDWIDGGAALYRLTAWDAVGEWRAEYGFYGEDVDWGHRVRKAGLKVQIDLGARVTHKMSGTASKYHRWQRYMLARNRALGAKLNLSDEEFKKVYGYLLRSALIRIIKQPFCAEERIYLAGIKNLGKEGLIDPLTPILDSDSAWKRVLGIGVS